MRLITDEEKSEKIIAIDTLRGVQLIAFVVAVIALGVVAVQLTNTPYKPDTIGIGVFAAGALIIVIYTSARIRSLHKIVNAHWEQRSEYLQRNQE